MGLIENAKDAAKLVQQIGNLELYEKLVSMQTDAITMLDENWKLKDENRSLKEKIEEQRKLLEISEDMEYVQDGGFYVKKSEKNDGKSIPYCPLCWTVNKIAAPLNPGSAIGFYACNIHKSQYHTAAYREHQRQSNEKLNKRTAPLTPWS